MTRSPCSDFTYGWFAWLTEAFRAKGYRFADFTQAGSLLAQSVPFVLMRHDVDMDLLKAAEFAEFEAELGVTATYFVLPRCEHYNLFSRQGSDAVARILAAGHRLGLHFDCAAYPELDDPGLLANACNREADLLRNWFACDISIVSFHRPGALRLSSDSRLTDPLPHTYQPLFTERMHYCSDSTGSWRYGRPTEQAAFHNVAPMQILTHPIWWHNRHKQALDCLADFVQQQQQRLHRSLEANCSTYDRQTLRNRLHAKDAIGGDDRVRDVA